MSECECTFDCLSEVPVDALNLPVRVCRSSEAGYAVFMWVAQFAKDRLCTWYVMNEPSADELWGFRDRCTKALHESVFDEGETT